MILHPASPVLLITDPHRTRLALREAAATLLYRLQGRRGGSAPPDSRSQRSCTAGHRADGAGYALQRVSLLAPIRTPYVVWPSSF